MHRCFIESSNWSGSEITLSGGEAHHLIKVMRACAGDPVVVFDGRGREAEATVRSVKPAVLGVLRERVHSRPLPFGVTLIQALPKGGNMDLIVEKVTELGVSTIIPVITGRVVARPDAGGKKIERWRKLAVSAAKQCGTCWVPEVKEIVSFEDVLRSAGRPEFSLIGSLHDGARPMREVLRSELGKKPAEVGVFIGPEGDFTSGEMEMAVKAGVIPVRFGELVLRVETAAIYAVSALVYEGGSKQ